MDFDDTLDWNEYVKLFAGLFAITNALSALPFYVTVSARLSRQDGRRLATAVAVAYTLTMALFAVLGEQVLAFFGITLPAFKVAGGILLLLSALRMMAAETREAEPVQTGRTGSVVGLAVVPLTIPMLAGPGAITTVIVYAHDHYSAAHTALVVAVVVGVALAVLALFRAALAVSEHLGPTAVGLLNQVMGLIVASIGVEFILEGLSTHFGLV